VEGAKYGQLEHEEPHVLIWSETVSTRLSDEARPTVDKEAVIQAIKAIRDDGHGKKFTDNKVNIVCALITEWDRETYAKIRAHLDEHLWERSMLNSEIVGAKELRSGYPDGVPFGM